MVKKSRVNVAGKDLVSKIKQLVSRGDVRRVCLMEEEKSILEIPITTGDIYAPANMVRAPVLAAINAFSTLVNECTIEVESEEPTKNK